MPNSDLATPGAMEQTRLAILCLAVTTALLATVNTVCSITGFNPRQHFLPRRCLEVESFVPQDQILHPRHTSAYTITEIKNL